MQPMARPPRKPNPWIDGALYTAATLFLLLIIAVIGWQMYLWTMEAIPW